MPYVPDYFGYDIVDYYVHGGVLICIGYADRWVVETIGM